MEAAATENPELLEDERWKLVMRILASRGFQRAGQLRAMLKYLVAESILHPDRTVRELELAHEVLGRRGDFDPLTDNIVRAQMSHLRRKLEAFYLDEGRNETLRVVMPKGSYQPQFTAITNPAEAHPPTGPLVLAPDASPRPAVDAPEALPASARGLSVLILSAACLALTILSVSLWVRGRTSPAHPAVANAESNEFVKFLVRRGGSVSVVMPDTSLMMLQNVLQTDISVAEYLRSDFLSEQISRNPDPGIRGMLMELHDKRNTSAGESAAAVDIVSTLTANGLPTSVRYARDMRTRDLGEGNAIIIGSQRSNPWTKLFSDQLNFRFRQDADPTRYSYWNSHSRPGEQERYVPYVLQSGKYSSYVDVAICPNLTQSGYVMMVIGSDMQGNEAAIRFLLHGVLPPSVSGLFSGRELGVYEVFLQSRHAQGEAEENFDVVAVRSSRVP